MGKIEIISPIWKIRHKATLKSYFMCFIIFNKKEYILMKRKNMLWTINPCFGSFYIRKKDLKAYDRLDKYYFWYLIQSQKEKLEVMNIEKYFIKINKQIFNGWHLVELKERFC